MVVPVRATIGKPLQTSSALCLNRKLMERRHKRELTLGVHQGLKNREEVKQMEPTEEIKKAAAGERGKPGPCRMVGFGVGRTNGVQAPRAPSQGDRGAQSRCEDVASRKPLVPTEGVAQRYLTSEAGGTFS